MARNRSNSHEVRTIPLTIFQILAKDTHPRNVPGIAVYFSTLQKIRGVMSRTTYFSIPQTSRSQTTLPTISSQGNLLAGATTRVVIGFILNPFSVLKARFEVRQSRHSVEQRSLTVMVERAVFIFWRGECSCVSLQDWS